MNREKFLARQRARDRNLSRAKESQHDALAQFADNFNYRWSQKHFRSSGSQQFSFRILSVKRRAQLNFRFER